MSPPLLALLVLFFTTATAFLLAWPIVARLALSPAERVVANAALSPLFTYAIGWTIYTTGLPVALLWLIPVLALTGLAFSWRALRETCRNVAARELLIGQALVTASCLCWLASIASYSGGGWAADWVEHWERTRFFLERWPTDRLLLGAYSLPARPPLANVVIGALMYPAGLDFARYQIATTLFSSLAFLPAALLVQRFSAAGRSVAVFAALVLVNPMFIQNATFAWTKLPAAVFILAGLAFFLRSRDSDAPRVALPLAGACLAGGILAHYSAAPYALMLGLLGLVRPRGKVFPAALLSALILTTWFAWSFATYGVGSTFRATSSVAGVDPSLASQGLRFLANFRDTLIPHFLRHPDPALIAQENPWGRLRDHFFQGYQLNLFLAFGSIAWVALLRELWHVRRTAARPAVRFWTVLIAGVIFLGIATHSSRDEWGLAHICLQSLVLLGLAFLASRWSGLGHPWRIALLTAAAADFLLGIVLHFTVQSFTFERWSEPAAMLDWAARQSETAVMNLAAKLGHKFAFVGDTLPVPADAWPLAAFALLLLAARRALPRTTS